MLVVVGEALMDMVPTECAGGHGHRARPGGSPYNVAFGCGRLNISTAYLGRLSTDAFGRRLVKRLQTADVDTSLVIDSDDLTALAFVHTDDRGIADYSFYMNGTAEVGLQPDDIPDTLHPDALHVGSISLVIEPMASTIAGLMQRLSPSATITMDPNVRSQFISDRDAYRARLHHLLAVTHFVKISDDDLAWLEPDEDPVHIAKSWLDRGPSLVIVTSGENGAVALTKDDTVQVPGAPVEVADTVGAGDSFMSAALAWLDERGALADLRSQLPGADALRDMMTWCVTAAGITCTRVGADPPHRKELP